QWLRKAILRASGHKALHDEDAIYRQQVAELSGIPRATGRRRDATAFTVAFKGVLLEGLEVVMIVLTLGTTSGRLGLAAAGAAAASPAGSRPGKPAQSTGRGAVTVARALQAFGRFWWDFLVGDTPELAVGALAVIGLAAALAGLGVAAAILVPLAVVALLAV